MTVCFGECIMSPPRKMMEFER